MNSILSIRKIRVEKRQQIESGKTRVYAQKPRVKIPFKNYISVLVFLFGFSYRITPQASRSERLATFALSYSFYSLCRGWKSLSKVAQRRRQKNRVRLFLYIPLPVTVHPLQPEKKLKLISFLVAITSKTLLS